MTLHADLELAQEAAVIVDEMIVRIHQTTGIPVDALLAGAHGCIVGMLAERLGHEGAAERCENAARRLRNPPSDQEAELAAARPMGSA